MVQRAVEVCTKLFGIGLILLTASCASTQLNYNTRDLASSVADDLIMRQILFNLSRTHDAPYAIPSQVSIPSGSATTTNSVTPQIGGPLSAQRLSTNQVQTAAAVTSTVVGTVTHPNLTFNVSSNDQWSQNWSLTPVSDPDQLRRLREIYQFGAGSFGIGEIAEERLACRYPLVQKAGGGGGGTPANTVTVTIKGEKPVTVETGGTSGGGGDQGYTRADCYSDKLAVGSPDPAFLDRPSCIMCAGEKNKKQLRLNSKLKNDWLKFSDAPILDLPPGAHFLGIYGNSFMYVWPILGAYPLKAQEEYFDFALFVLEATRQAQTASSSASGKGVIQSEAAPKFELH